MKIREQVKQNICIKMHSNMYLIPNQASVLPSSENRLTVNLGREVKHSEPICSLWNNRKRTCEVPNSVFGFYFLVNASMFRLKI